MICRPSFRMVAQLVELRVKALADHAGLVWKGRGIVRNAARDRAGYVRQFVHLLSKRPEPRGWRSDLYIV